MATKTAHKKKAVPQQTVQIHYDITQRELARYRALENKIDRMKTKLSEEELSLKDRLAANATVQPGSHTAEISTTFRRTPKWREEAISLADKLEGAGRGEIWATEVLNRTPNVPSVRLVVK